MTVLETALLALAALGPARGADDYEVRFHRPYAVGDRHRIVAQAGEEQTQTIRVDRDDQPASVRKLTVTAELVQTVEAIDARGRPTRLSLTVEKFVAADEAREIKLPAGTALVAVSEEDRTNFLRADGSDLDPVAAEALDLFIELGGGESGNDQIFATTGRHKPGDEWPVDGEATARRLAESGTVVKAEDVEGTTTLAKISKHAGQPCLDVRGRLHIKQFVPSGAPPGFSYQQASTDAELEILLPVEPTRQPPRYSESTKTTARLARSGEGPAVTIRVENTRTRKIEVAPVGK